MRYNNQYFLDNALTKEEAAQQLFDAADVWAVPDCGCPVVPDPEILKHTGFTNMEPEAIAEALGNKYQCFATITPKLPAQQDAGEKEALEE